MLLLSVLDQSPVRSGGTPAQAIQETLALAEAAERLGYHRYWLAEHHSTAGLAGSSPEILVGQVAGALAVLGGARGILAQEQRVGDAGVDLRVVRFQVGGLLEALDGHRQVRRLVRNLGPVAV